MRAASEVEVRLERGLVELRFAGVEAVVRLRAAEARDLAVRLLEVAYLARRRAAR